MRVRRFILILVCLLCAAGAWWFWPQVSRPFARVWTKLSAPHKFRPQSGGITVRSASTAPFVLLSATSTNKVNSAKAANPFPYRLANTRKPLAELAHDRHAILLENAMIDTGAKLDLAIPKSLQSHGTPGAYIVQAAGPIDNAFRARLAAAGAQIVSYIPNNAYLVQLAALDAGALASQPGVQAVLPYEPYYKVQASLMQWLDKPLPADAVFNLGVFPGSGPQTMQQIQNAGWTVLSQSRDIVRVAPAAGAANWTALAQLPGVHIVEPFYKREIANDLSRAKVGVSANSTTLLNWLNLSGSNVIVAENDSGVDATHPDLTGRVFSDTAASGTDTNGHGTHVAGIIMGSGLESPTITLSNRPSGSVRDTNASNTDFRGKAPLATLYSVAGVSANVNDNAGLTGDFTDEYFQEVAAMTNALIDNNSWRYTGDYTYDLAAASWDAATRDALPFVTGSQPILPVFAAGNEGGGDNNGGGGTADTIDSPASAKNVLSIGAIEQLRNITNTYLPHDSTNPVAAWKSMTDSSFQVAGYSSRGNVGIGTEGTFGRFKPDVVAPGTFVVSTRSSQWDQVAYYNPTNTSDDPYTDQIVDTNSPNSYPTVFVPDNAVAVVITITPNANSPTPFPNLPIYVSQNDSPDPTDPSTYDFVTSNNVVSIPNPDGGSAYLTQIQNGSINFTVADGTNFQVSYDLDVQIVTTNDMGNYFDVLRTNLNDPLGPYYRYETGTSMSAPAVSGVLALIQDFFTNTLHTTPSPALLKAMVINGARVVGNYTFAVTNNVNDQGWGLVNLANCLPFSFSTNASQIATNTCIYLGDQSPTNALATGDSHNYSVAFGSNSAARLYPLRVTLVWTDPPGDPAAAIKLVNNLDLIVTNLDNPTNPVVYYGNNFAAGGNPPFSLPCNTNGPNPDFINNVENIYLAPPLGTNLTVTVFGHAVNVNAVTAQTNNITQDYALVISSGEGEVPNAITVTDNGITSNPTGGQDIGGVTGTNSALMNQTVGANSPLLGTNNVGVAPGVTALGANALITLGQTNQWHFYIITNIGTANDFTNAAFVTFSPFTLSLPRLGVFADSQANATRPEADIDVYVSTDPTLTNLNPVVVSNCISGGVAPVLGTTFNGSSLTRGGTEFVVDTNSQPNEVYYVGVKSEDAAGSEYGFLSVFTDKPFSTTDQNKNIVIHALALPVNIPDGSPAHPGVTNIFALCVSPATVAEVVVTNQIWHQNFGDLIGVLQHNALQAVLNNNDGNSNTFGAPPLVYDDVHSGNFPGSIPSHGPATLRNFVGTGAIGPWILNEVDDALTHTGAVEGLDLVIVPHQTGPHYANTLPLLPNSWFYDYVDVPAGATNLIVQAEDGTQPPVAPPYLLLGVKFGVEPTLADINDLVTISNSIGGNLFGSISIGPPLQPGRYYFGVYNPPNGVVRAPGDISIKTILSFSASAVEAVTYTSTGPVPLLDDAVTTDAISINDIPNATAVQSVNVGLRVDHPRISDLVIHLIAPDGTRQLLMENRGGTSTAGCGATVITTNVIDVSANGTAQPNTNTLDVGETSGSFPITYNFYTAKDQMQVFYGADTDPANLVFDTGVTNNPSLGPGAQNTAPVTITVNFPPPGVTPNSTFLTIVMDANLPRNRSDAWTYTAGGVLTNYYYLVFTEDTNLTTTPIKYAPTPFLPSVVVTTNNVDDFEAAVLGDYGPYPLPSQVDIWDVDNNQASVVANSTDAQAGSNYLALANATIAADGAFAPLLPTIQGNRYTLSFSYRGPGIAGWWQGDGTNTDAIYGDNAILENGVSYANAVVNAGFNFNGTNSFVLIQATNRIAITNSFLSTSSTNLALDVGQGSGFTIEGWIITTNAATEMTVAEYERQLGTASSADIGVYFNLNTTNGIGAGPGSLYADIVDTNGTDHPVAGLPATTIVDGGPHHIALTYDKVSGYATLFADGVLVSQTLLGTFTPQTSFANLLLGARTTFASVANPTTPFAGGMDEMSVYGRALSASEILAIFDAWSAGKYDAAYYGNFSPAGSLAEASVTIPGVAPTVINGNNTNWQTENITFTATASGTPVTITGLEPGMLLDTFTLTTLPGDLYYLPEQDMSQLIGVNAYGTWTLEVQDNRAGATNNTTLVSWDLQFTFANTNIGVSPGGALFGGQGVTNTIIANGLTYFTINVPNTAHYATNLLLFADLPLNVFFSTNYLPTITNAGDVDIFPGATNGSDTISTNNSLLNTSSAYIVPGATYYLVVQNTNNVPVTFGLQVNFDVAGQFSSLQFAEFKPTATGAQLQWPAAPGAHYQVQWTDSLSSPWHTLVNPHATTINGVTTFNDNGTQTGPASQTRFYRLVQVR